MGNRGPGSVVVCPEVPIHSTELHEVDAGGKVWAVEGCDGDREAREKWWLPSSDSLLSGSYTTVRLGAPVKRGSPTPE